MKIQHRNAVLFLLPSELFDCPDIVRSQNHVPKIHYPVIKYKCIFIKDYMKRYILKIVK